MVGQSQSRSFIKCATPPSDSLRHNSKLILPLSYSDLLTLPDDLAILEEAGKTPVEQLSSEVTQLDNQIKKIQNQMNAPNTQSDVKNQSREFLQYASKEVELMKEHMASLKTLQVELAEFFCEDPKTFKMEECFDSLAKFCKKFKEAISENVKRKEQEALAEQRRILREQEEAKKARNGKNTIKFPRQTHYPQLMTIIPRFIIEFHRWFWVVVMHVGLKLLDLLFQINGTHCIITTIITRSQQQEQPSVADAASKLGVIWVDPKLGVSFSTEEGS